MNIEERFCLYQNTKQNELRAEAVEAAVRTSKEAFYASEQENMLSYHEFLWMQLKFIQKRWWLFQMGLLTVLWVMLSVTGEAAEIKKGLGVTASLFVILMIPEIWKNRSSHSTEIEAASFYSLKQIYAARMTLFALVDVILLSIFCGISTATARIAFTELIVQFLLPMSISACICFQVLCSKQNLNEVMATVLCLFWNAVWTLILLNETIYRVITQPVWFLLLGGSAIYLYITVHRVLNNCNRDWEGNKAWN